jgi:membrane protein required for colicin V production
MGWRDAAASRYITPHLERGGSMTWVDGIVLAVLVVSAVLAFLRGFVREALGIAAWAGAAYAAIRAFPYVEPHVRKWIQEVGIADPVALAIVFVIALIILSIIAARLARLVRRSPIGGLDRTLGLVFGLARGAALVIAAYIIGQRIVPVERWPDPVLEARALPLAYRGAAWVVAKLPQDYRPQLEAPPTNRPTRAADLMQANPHGYALPGRAASNGATRDHPARDQETR